MPEMIPPLPAGASPNRAQSPSFTDHGLRSALELLGRVPIVDASLVCDLGCGSGAITRMVAERFPDARVVGVDYSSEMLKRASEHTSCIEWLQADIAGWEPEQPPDLIFSNATLHWLDDHPTLLPRLFGFLAPGGCLAVQVPVSHSRPSHVLMGETLANGGVNGVRLGDEGLEALVTRKWVLEADEYHDLLARCAATLDIWETEYFLRLEGDDAVLGWVKATGLRPILLLNGLRGDDLKRFMEVYRKRLRGAYPRRVGGYTLYALRRLFIVATRGI